MPKTTTSIALESIIKTLESDLGLKAQTSAKDIAAGIAAARQLNDVLGQAIEHFKFNADKVITPDELKKVSDYVRATPLLHYNFLMGHGDDEGNVETGFHKLQNDGGSLLFQGRNMIDTVIDAIYHYGETYIGGRFVNEDGNQNEEVNDVAGWLNYFLNGKNIIFGTSGADELGSGDYTGSVAKAANETFKAGAGNDKVWAYTGDDKVYAGTGNDTVGGGSGKDTIYGEDGADTLYGDSYSDFISGGAGNDEIGGGTGNNKLYGDAGNDTIGAEKGDDLIEGGDGDDVVYGGDGDNTLNGNSGDDDISGGKDNDLMSGGSGNDKLYGGGSGDKIYGGSGNDNIDGGTGNDKLSGNDGKDTISAGLGADRVTGGAGADITYLWDSNEEVDTIVFNKGDSGRTLGSIDVIEGFQHGEDKIDLASFGKLTFEAIDFEGGGKGSVYYDGRYLRIDDNGDRATDIMIEFKWVDKITASDLLFGS